MPHPDALLAAADLARALDALERLFGDAEPYRLLRDRGRALLAAT
jgi:hypothetical protein